MRNRNPVATKRAQLSISDNVDRILEAVAQMGILGKTKTEVASRIVSDWIWTNQDKLKSQGIVLMQERKRERS
jgi:hypothetical protein